MKCFFFQDSDVKFVMYDGIAAKYDLFLVKEAFYSSFDKHTQLLLINFITIATGRLLSIDSIFLNIWHFIFDLFQTFFFGAFRTTMWLNNVLVSKLLHRSAS